jgi:hypothetical protein
MTEIGLAPAVIAQAERLVGIGGVDPGEEPDALRQWCEKPDHGPLFVSSFPFAVSL